jgi:hypothetical protein
MLMGSPQQQFVNQAQISNRQMRNLMPQQPQEYLQPGVPGSQVPKYSAAPYGSDPNAVYARVIKVDRFGKKRSFLRKMRVPETGQQGMNIPNIGQNSFRNVTPQQQYVRYNPQYMQQAPQPEIGGFRQGMLIDEGFGRNFDATKLAGFTQAPEINTMRLVNTSSSMSFNPEMAVNSGRILEFVKRRNREI